MLVRVRINETARQVDDLKMRYPGNTDVLKPMVDMVINRITHDEYQKRIDHLVSLCLGGYIDDYSEYVQALIQISECINTLGIELAQSVPFLREYEAIIIDIFNNEVTLKYEDIRHPDW